MEKHFVDVANLESEIDAVLNTKECFNFCIDTQGNKYKENKDGSLSKMDAEQWNNK